MILKMTDQLNLLLLLLLHLFLYKNLLIKKEIEYFFLNIIKYLPTKINIGNNI